MVRTKSELINLAAEKAAQQWQADRSPYLISDIGNDLKDMGAFYKEIIGEEYSLTSFLRANAAGKFKVVVHPDKKAKVGVIPPNEEYDFNAVPSRLQEAERGHSAERQRKQTPRKYVVLNFLEALAELDNSDLEQVQLPLTIIKKLLSGK